MKFSIPKIIFALLLMATSSTLFAQRFFPTVDTFIDERAAEISRVQNSVNSHKLEVRKFSGQQRITFIEFNVDSFNEQVSKADLCLYLFYASAVNQSEVIDVYEVTSENINNDITWTNLNGNYTLSATPVTSLTVTTAAVLTDSYGWYRFDIKDVVNRVAATSGSNKKIKLALKAQSTNLLVDFYSSEQTNYPHYRPFLVMTPAANTGLVEESKTIAAQDSYVYSSAIDTKYDEQRLLINYYKEGTSKQFRYANLRFNVPTTPLAENNRVTVKTKVYAAQSGENVVYLVDLLGINDLDDAINVNQFTWNTMPTAENYTYLRSRFFIQSDKINETDIEWDVTNYVKAQQTAGKTLVNFSLQIPELGGAVGHNLAFYARNYLNADPATTNVPQLIVYGSVSSINQKYIDQNKKVVVLDGKKLFVTDTNQLNGQIFNLQGGLAKSFSHVSSIDISSLSRGIYILKLDDNSLFKFIK